MAGMRFLLPCFSMTLRDFGTARLVDGKRRRGSAGASHSVDRERPFRAAMSESPLNHPSDEELRELSLGRLVATDVDRVCAHLGDCPGCCHRIDLLAAEDPLLARLRRSDAGREERLVGPAQRRSAVRALRRGQAAPAPLRDGKPGKCERAARENDDCGNETCG
jgi:hypothetical protein